MSEQTIPEMRERIDALDKANKKLEGDLKVQVQTNRTLQAKEVFRDKGFDPKHGELFATTNPDGDITGEAVEAFVEQWSLSAAKETPATEETAPVEGTEQGAPSTASTNLAGMNGGGSGPGGGGQPAVEATTLTKDQWHELNRTDPVAAREALSRVELRKDNPLASHR